MNMEDTIKEFKDCISFDSGYIVDNYPYGFKRTQIKFWVETKGNKQRFVSCTLNPVTLKWNNPKPSTYNDLVVMYREKETGHIRGYHFNIGYSDVEDFNRLKEFLGDYKTPYIENLLKLSRAVYETRKHIKVVVRARQFRHKVTGEIRETVPLFNMAEYEEVSEEEQDLKQKEVSKDINKLFVSNALKEGLTVEEIKRI